jgi:hypothetical protein
MPRPSSHSILVGISSTVEVFLRGGESGAGQKYERWGEWERQALHELGRYAKMFPVGAAQLGLWRGVAHWLNGRSGPARSEWRGAIAEARRLGLRKDESIIAAEIRRRQAH